MGRPGRHGARVCDDRPYQWATRDVFWNPKVKVGNAYAPFFRVNSVFWDPSIYGRYLTVGILTALAGVLLRGTDGRRLAVSTLVAAMWVGLFFSVLPDELRRTRRRGDRRWSRRAGAGAPPSPGPRWRSSSRSATLVVPQVRNRIRDQSRSVSTRSRAIVKRSSARAHGSRLASPPLLRGGRRRFQGRVRAKRVELHGRQRPKTAASPHDPGHRRSREGLAGLAASCWLLLAALSATCRRLGHGFTSRVSFAVGLTLPAIAVHSVFYNALFEDPMTWAAAGLPRASRQACRGRARRARSRAVIEA